MGLERYALNTESLDKLFAQLLQKLEDWYADPQRAIAYDERPPVRSGPHGESKPALPVGRPPINWRTEWRAAESLPAPQARKREICWAILYELDPRAPQTSQYRDFYDQVRYRVERESTVGRPLTASLPTSGRRPAQTTESRAVPTHV